MDLLSNTERLNLKKMVDNSECENNTEQIRKLKHSVLIRDDIRKMDTFKKANEALKTSDPEKYLELCKETCTFLFNNYTDLFNKVLKDELDFTIMTKLLIVLKMIEDEKVDQHEGSVMVGKILKELYIDSAMKRGENLDKEHATEKEAPNEGLKLSWKQYKFLVSK
jgi:hypothetical protein